MVREGFISGKNDYTKVGTVLISLEQLERRINEEKAKEQKEIEEAKKKAQKEQETFQKEQEAKAQKEQKAFEVQSRRLLNSDEYIYVSQFAKKYGINFNSNELSKLQRLLKTRGFEFSLEQTADVLTSAFSQQRLYEAKSKILNQETNEFKSIVKSYLNFYRSDDDQMLEVLKEILIEKGFLILFGNSLETLKGIVEKTEKEIELEIFEKKLLDEDTQRTTLTDLDSISGYEFEYFLKNLFSKMGCQVEQTRLSGDQGADLVVVKFGEKTVIQAKRSNNKIGNKAVQEIMAAISLYKARKGMVITNNYFTPAAVELANANNIELIGRDALEELINKHW